MERKGDAGEEQRREESSLAAPLIAECSPEARMSWEGWGIVGGLKYSPLFQFICVHSYLIS